MAERERFDHKVNVQVVSIRYVYNCKIQWPLDTLSTHTKPKTEIRNGEMNKRGWGRGC